MGNEGIRPAIEETLDLSTYVSVRRKNNSWSTCVGRGSWSVTPTSESTHANERGMMRRSYLGQLAVFVLVLIGLNLFFRLHISIIGSLILTVVLSLAFSSFRRRR